MSVARKKHKVKRKSRVSGTTNARVVKRKVVKKRAKKRALARKKKTLSRSAAAKLGWARRKERAVKKKRRTKKNIRRIKREHPQLVGIEKDFEKRVAEAVAKRAEQLREDAREEAREELRGEVARDYYELREAELRRRIKTELTKDYAAALLKPQNVFNIAARQREKLAPALIRQQMADMVETDESIMLGRLIIAEQLGNFDGEAYALAEEYDWLPQEVYGLWWGYS